MDKCTECLISRHSFSLEICFKCNNLVCFACQDSHVKINGNNHLFKFPFLSYNFSCQRHRLNLFEKLCFNCNTVLCFECVKDHTHHDIRDVKDASKEKVMQVEKEIAEIEKSIIHVKLGSDLRIQAINNFEGNVEKIRLELEEESKLLSALMSENRKLLLSLKEPGNNKELCMYTTDIKTLSALSSIYVEIKKMLMNLKGKSHIDPIQFLQQHEHYRHIVNNCVTFPKFPDDKNVPLQVNYEKSSEEDIQKVLLRFWLGNSVEDSAIVTNDSSTVETKYIEQDKMIKNLQDQLKLATDELKKQQQTSAFDLQKGNDNNKKLQNRLKSTEEIVQNLKQRLARTESEQEALKIKEHDKKSGVEIQKWKNKCKELEDILEETAREKTEQERLFRELEKRSVAEIQKWKDKSKELEAKLEETEKGQTEQERLSTEQKMLSNVEILKWKENYRELENRIMFSDEKIQNLQQRLETSEGENEELQNRLSQGADANLTAGNSNITDLSDKFRPMRIAEMYSELYDSEWSTAKRDISALGTRWTEHDVVRHLFIVLQECFHTCKYIASNQMTVLCEQIFLGVSKKDLVKYIESYITELKQLKNARKGTAPSVSKILQDIVYEHDMFATYCALKYNETKTDLIEEIKRTEYGKKCVSVCWFMVVQDPEMFLDGDLRPGVMFNHDAYKEYTVNGRHVAFSVWPALFLRMDGPLITKGVAQGCD